MLNAASKELIVSPVFNNNDKNSFLIINIRIKNINARKIFVKGPARAIFPFFSLLIFP